MRGIDISEHQGHINLEALKDQIDFVIIRAGYADVIDQLFERNYAECKRLGIPCGAYWYSYALDVGEAINEARACLNVISNKQFEYPIYLDMEDADHYKANHGFNFSIVKAISEQFCQIIQDSGYYVGIYASKSWFDSHLAGLDQFDKWIAEWGTNDGTIQRDYSEVSGVGMLQYTSVARLNGYGGSLDANIAYNDFMTLIKENRLNGYGDGAQEPVQAPQQTLKHHVGEYVSFGSCYASSTAKVGWPPNGEALVPDIKEGTITAIYEGTNNPYLINDGMCFVNDGDIREGTSNPDRQYVVQGGDTLWDIAAQQLGDPTRYRDIMVWNGLSSDTIYPGQVLIIKE